MKNGVKSLGMALLGAGLLVGGCAKETFKATSTTGVDVTTRVLPSLTGQYASPSASLLIRADGSFSLLTKQELTRWTSTQSEPHEQHSAKCDIQRSGTLHIFELRDFRYVIFSANIRSVFGNDQEDDVSVKTREICGKAMSLMTSDSSLRLRISQNLGSDDEGKGFMLSQWAGDADATILEDENKTAQKLRADSAIPAFFGTLFIREGKTADVSQLAARFLAKNSKPSSETEPTGLVFNPAQQTFRFTFKEKDCHFDVTSPYKVISSGDHVLIQTIDTLKQTHFHEGPTQGSISCQLIAAKFMKKNEPIFDLSEGTIQFKLSF